jgi:hypothetical protein
MRGIFPASSLQFVRISNYNLSRLQNTIRRWFRAQLDETIEHNQTQNKQVGLDRPTCFYRYRDEDQVEVDLLIEAED